MQQPLTKCISDDGSYVELETVIHKFCPFLPHYLQGDEKCKIGPWFSAPVALDVVPLNYIVNGAGQHSQSVLVHCKLPTNIMRHSTEAYTKWPLYHNVFDQPPAWLTSRCPEWSDMTHVDITAQWKQDWLSASVVKHTIVTGLTILPAGFHFLVT